MNAFFPSEKEPVGQFTGKNEYMILEPLKFHSGILGLITVPANTVTDFASIPRFFWRVLPPWDTHRRAAIVHDFLYSTQRHEGKPLTQKTADQVFREAMIALDVPGWKVATMYRALRMFGWAAWNSHAKRIRQEAIEEMDVRE